MRSHLLRRNSIRLRGDRHEEDAGDVEDEENRKRGKGDEEVEEEEEEEEVTKDEARGRKATATAKAKAKATSRLPADDEAREESLWQLAASRSRLEEHLVALLLDLSNSALEY